MEDLPSVETAVSGPCLVAKVRGVMDYGSQLELRGRLTQVIDRAERAVVLDLSDVSFGDSAGLNVLLGARRRRKSRRRDSWPRAGDVTSWARPSALHAWF